jgi:hypothetical protein
MPICSAAGLLYPAGMEIYDVELTEGERLASLAKPRRWLVFAVCFVSSAAFFSFALIWPEPAPVFLFPGTHVSYELVYELVRAVFLPFFWSLLMSWYFCSKSFLLGLTKSWKNYQIVIEEDRISTRGFSSQNWMISKSILRDKVRTIIENKKGLLVSDRGRLGTYLFARIWIPNQLPDYEYLKRLVTSWKVQESLSQD